MCEKRISTRYVDHNKGMFFRGTVTLSTGNGFSGPVARVLLHTCKSVKNGAFADVWIACKSDDLVIVILFDNIESGINCIDADRTACKPHFSPSPSAKLKHYI